MTLKERILDDIKTAMKSHDDLRKSVLRMVLSEIKYAQTAVDARAELDDDAVLEVVAKYKKRLEKSLKDYPEGDKKETIKKELVIVAEYGPKELNEEELVALAKELQSASPEADFGLLMREAKKRVGPSFNGQMMSAVLKKVLG